MGSLYDKSYLKRCLLILIGVTALMKVTSGMGFLLMVPLIIYALATNKQEDLLFYLIFISTSVVCNSKVMPKNMLFFMTQRVLLAFLAATLGMQVFGRQLPKIFAPIWLMVLYIVYMILPSSVGWSPIVSYMKILLFLICMGAFMGVSARVLSYKKLKTSKLRSIMLAFAIYYLLGSILLIPFPGISQLSGQAYMEAMASGQDITSLFIGMTNQSQCMGPVVALLSCFVLSDLLFSIKKPDKLYILLLACAPILIYKTSSRTAMCTYIAANLMVLYFFFQARGITSRWRSRVFSGFMFITVLCLAALLASTSARQGVIGFALKYGTEGKSAADISFKEVTSTRQGLMDRAIDNFKKSPAIGNGFQVSEIMQDMKVNSIVQLLSAPVEKGVWVTAVLEEGGVCGMILVLIFISVMMVTLVRSKAYLGFGMFFTMVMSNLGEFSIFSMSYIGGFMWAMLFLALNLDVARLRERKIGSLPRIYMPPPMMGYRRW